MTPASTPPLHYYPAKPAHARLWHGPVIRVLWRVLRRGQGAGLRRRMAEVEGLNRRRNNRHTK